MLKRLCSAATPLRVPMADGVAKNSSAGDQSSTLKVVSFDDHTSVKLPSASSATPKKV